MGNVKNAKTVLGLDIGPNSIGWALIADNEGNSQEKRISSGARVFQGGLDGLETDARGQSRNLERREARGRRRMLERTARRLTNLAATLQSKGLLPSDYDVESADQRYLLFQQLDSTLDSPYQLRARALDKKLDPFELGRAIYHLAQRRGFLSNRKSPVKDDEDEKGIKKNISELNQEITESGARTLGEYFAGLNSRAERIRNRYTSRKMYENEFDLIWSNQSQYYPDLLTESFQNRIYKLIFHQRPLKSQSHLIGKCELEEGRKRAPWAFLSAQRYRYLQRLNDLEVLHYDTGEVRKLNDEERALLIQELEVQSEMIFSKIRKLLKLPRASQFNLEMGGEKKIPGNKTAARLIKVFGKKRWDEFTEVQRNHIVEDYLSIVKDETLTRRGMKKWGLDEETAKEFGRMTLEDGYCRFSRKAIDNLLPLLKEGVSLQTAIKECYPKRFAREGQPEESLPPFEESGISELRNPIVERSLTEIRRIVNALISRYGKPDMIRIEMARELRQNAKERERSWKKMRAIEKDREAARMKLVKEANIENPTARDIQKVLLAEECNWTCPYTGKQISVKQLVGDYPEFDIEHIIPFERSLDNSFVNKTLSCVRENREVKGKRTPYEAYHGTPQWDEIITRVKKFQGDMRHVKLRRFQFDTEDVKEFLSKFTSRQLNDTRWSARLTKRYLGLLYGGVNDDGIDAGGKRRVHAISGPITAYLRRQWGIEGIFSGGDAKSRDEHRHHAIDAITVALTTQAMVKSLSDSAEKASDLDKRLFKEFPQPWEGFYRDVEETINGIITSHRLSKRVRGALHKETFYSPPEKDADGKTYVTIRKPIDNLTVNEAKNIVSPVIQELVNQKLKESGKSPQETFKDRDSHPRIKGKNGVEIPAHHVRIRKTGEQVFKVGEGCRTRYVESDSIHHMELFRNETTGKWDCEVVSMYEAYQRKRNKQPIVNRIFGEGKTFLFSIAGGEIIELDDLDNSENRSLYVVRTVPKSKQIYFVPVNDARMLKDIGKKGLTAPPETLRKRNCRKVVVTPLGEVRNAND